MARKTRLDAANVSPDPIAQFQKWFRAAVRAGLHEPNAMTLATSTAEGRPSARMVLLKGVTERGFVFYTNYESRKGQELAANPYAALVFYWAALGLQVRVTGRVAKVPAAESDKYFASRPLGSRFGALASRQSTTVESRSTIEEAFAAMEAQYPNGDPPRPNYWGGYCVRPEEIEFWQAAPSRLHDRIRYRRRKDGTWRVDRLSP